VYEYDTTGNESVLHRFGGADGQYPGEVLALGGNASGVVVYDTTQQGGTSGWVLYSTLSPEI
jgi:hypothetical protein